MATSPSLGITKRLAEFSLGLKYEDLAPQVIADARNALLDTLGVALVGSAEPPAGMLLNIVASGSREGPATVLGSDVTAIPTAAALVNGYAAHALDYDDTQHNVGSHMSAPVVPAALAVAEMFHRSGKDLLTAYVVGFEVGCRLGRAGRFATHLSKRGIHSTGYLGHFGAAAAASKLLGLDALNIRRSFGIAAGHASGILKNFGTMGKAQNAANAAQNAVLSVLLAQQGFTGPEEMFDGEQNIFSICGGQTNPEELFQGLGEEFEITHNTLKVFACAGWRNPIVEASMHLAASHNLKPGDIKAATISAYKGVSHLPNYKEPRTGLESKFSAEHAAAVALVDQAGGVKQFSDERVTDPVVTEVRRKMTLEIDETLAPYQIRVALRTNDGRDLMHFIPSQKGDHLNPLSWDELVTKFSANASTVLPPANGKKLSAMIADLESVNDVAELTRLCRPGKSGQKRRKK